MQCWLEKDTELCLRQVVYMLTPSVNMHFKVLCVEFGGGRKVSFHSCGFPRRGKPNLMQAFSRPLISRFSPPFSPNL